MISGDQPSLAFAWSSCEVSSRDCIIKASFININSFVLRVSEIKLSFQDKNLDILCLVETRLKPDMSFKLNFPGYSLYRNDRVLRGGGGVALIARSKFLVSLLCLSSETIFDARCEPFGPFLTPRNKPEIKQML